MTAEHPIHPWREGCVLVTGAAGFLGQRLSAKLLEDGLDVHCVSRRARSIGSAQWSQIDLTDANSTQQLLDRVRPQVVYHLAGLPSAGRSLELVVPTMQDNLITAVNVMAAATKLEGTRVILAGSLEEGLELGAGVSSSSPYAMSKQATSAYARMFDKLYDLPVVTAKIFMVYGPGQTDTEKLVPYVIRSLLNGEAPQLGNGERPVDWIFIDDVVDALVTMAGMSGLDGKTVDVGSGELVTIRALVERVRGLMSTEVVASFGGRAARRSETILKANVERTRALTGWSTQTSLEDGLHDTIDWYRANFGAGAGEPGITDS